MAGVCAAVRTARHEANAAVIDRLERSCAAQREALRTGVEVQSSRLNNEFHRLTVARCGNGTLTAHFSHVVNQLRTAQVDPRGLEVPSAATGEHQKLVVALRDRDVAAAETAAKLHAGIPA